MSKKSAIRMVTPVKDLGKFLGGSTEEGLRKIAAAFAYVGEQCLTIARNLPSPDFGNTPRHLIPPHQPNYIDWTENLRNSIGYVVLLNGRVFSEKPGERPETQSLLAELIPQLRTGVVLIVAAGMNYAGYVEAKGYDVLTSARLKTPKLVDQILSQLKTPRK